MSKELSFNAVDDLVAAHARGKLGQPRIGNEFAPTYIAPFVELSFSPGFFGSAVATSWLDTTTQVDFRRSLKSSRSLWIDAEVRRGFMRSVYDPLNSEHDVPRTQFFMAARRAAETAGLSIPVAQYMTAALRELESNIREHSGKADTGLMAFQVGYDFFEFVVADRGVGVLATLREAPQFKTMSDHGQALHSALQVGVSRRGHDHNHGNGFRDLFLGLQDLKAELRFRSGDHALIINGSRPELKNAHLVQKSNFDGFLASVRCFASPHRAIH